MPSDAQTEHMVQRFCITLTHGTSDPLQTHLGVVNGFAQVKIGNKVDFVLMGEGGNVVDDKVLRQISGFGLPPMANLLDAPEMNDPDLVSWTV